MEELPRPTEAGGAGSNNQCENYESIACCTRAIDGAELMVRAAFEECSVSLSSMSDIYGAI